MNLGLKNKRALVTGGSRGIGKAIAMDLAREGVKVAIVARMESDLKSVFNKMGGRKKGHYYVAADLMEEGSVREVVRDIWKNFGQIDVLINNLGGTLRLTDPVGPIDDWRKVFRLNFDIAVEFNNLLIPHMKKKKRGRIVHISSLAALEQSASIPYCTAKTALAAYTKNMGRFLAKEGIVVSAVLPGAVMASGGHWDRLLRNDPDYVRKYVKNNLPLSRFGRPEEISSVVLFLCSKLASFCQGTIILVDGGQGRHYFGTCNPGE